MSNASFSIADLPVVDDLNVPVSSESYADQQNPQPPAPGNYRFQLVKVEPKTSKAGELILQDGKYPIIVLVQAKIVEPTENERLVGLFQDVRTKPSIRRTPQGDMAVNDFYDLLRAFDASVTIEGFEHGKQLLQQYLDSNATFVGGLGWAAQDFAYIEQEFAKLGVAEKDYDGRRAVAKDVANAIYNKARLKTKNFMVNGKRSASIVGPSGEVIEARPVISRYFSTALSDYDKTVSNLGPFKK
jgi:hypothetical protein